MPSNDLPFPADPARPVAILCALPEEAAEISAALGNPWDEHLGPIKVHRGTIGDIPVAVALAGIGKVDAAMAATLLASAGARAFIVAGVGGALNPAVGIGDIVVGTRLLQHDYGLETDEGLVVYAAGQLPVPTVVPTDAPRLGVALEGRIRAALKDVSLPAMSVRLDEPPRRPTIHFGTIATGDIFVNGPRVRQRIADLGALAVDMEGAAVARVAERFGVPCVVLRAASDLAGRESALDLATFLPVAAKNVSRIVELVLPVL